MRKNKRFPKKFFFKNFLAGKTSINNVYRFWNTGKNDSMPMKKTVGFVIAKSPGNFPHSQVKSRFKNGSIEAGNKLMDIETPKFKRNK